MLIQRLRFFATVQTEGKRKVERNIAFYNLDMIISVGYRVHSYRGVQLRMWATRVLKEYKSNAWQKKRNHFFCFALDFS